MGLPVHEHARNLVNGLHQVVDLFNACRIGQRPIPAADQSPPNGIEARAEIRFWCSCHSVRPHNMVIYDSLSDKLSSGGIILVFEYASNLLRSIAQFSL